MITRQVQLVRLYVMEVEGSTWKLRVGRKLNTVACLTCMQRMVAWLIDLYAQDAGEVMLS